MTIGQKIIFSSSLVAFLAALAPFMGMKSTQSVRDKLVKTLSQSTDEILILDELKTKVTEIQTHIYRTVKEINIAPISDSNKYFTNGQSLATQINELQNQIGNFVQTNTDEDLKKLPQLCESFREVSDLLYPSNKSIPESRTAFKAGTDTKVIVDDFLESLQNANNTRYQIIKNEGKTVEAEISSLNFWIMLIGGLTCLMAIVFGRIIANNLSTEITKLHQAADQLNKGDYSVRVESTSNDEFGQLGQTFDGMAANLEQSQVIEKQKSEMERLNAQLRIKNDSLDSFVYRVSHDLKAPVVNIRSLLTMIKLKLVSKGNEELVQPFFFLDKSVDKLEQTIFDLLEVSRIEESLESSKDWVNLEEKLAQVINENSEHISTGDVTITSDFKVSRLYFSIPNLDSILSNLITNGIKYRSANRPPKIHLSTERVDGFVCLRIKDNGVGMDLEKHGEKLFGMFNRFHNHVEGSGVGLYIVKKIIENAGGRIEVESQVEQGTTFNIFFDQKNVPALAEMQV